MKIKYWIFLFVSLSSTDMLFTQTNSNYERLHSFVNTINAFSQLLPQEKVYLHFDNNAYYAGETIWFKAYVVEAENHANTEISKIVYVDLMSPEGFLLETKKLKIENGQCHGEFSLNDTVFAGYYEVRAYTLNMLNFGDECMFSRVFPVYDKPAKEGDYAYKSMRVRPRISVESAKNSKPQESLNMTFFPEGGNLVRGIYSKVAFNAVNELGQSVIVQGVVCNSKGEEITSVVTSYQGAGMFMLCPDGAKYTVKVRFNDKEYKFTLPDCLKAGYVMSINNTSVDVLVVQLDKLHASNTQADGLTISCRGKVYLFDTVRSQSDTPLILKFPKKDLISGVNQLTLFDAAGKIYAERLFFVEPLEKELLTIKATKSKSTYQPFEEVNINLQANTPNGSPVQTDVSVSITDASTTDLTYDPGNILSNLLLSSDLKGYIEDPKQYFVTSDNQRNGKLDLLLMTQGWRRYSWRQEACLDSFELRYDMEGGLSIRGSVLQYDKYGDSKKMSDIEVLTMIISENGTFEKNTRTNQAGDFFIPVQDFQGKAELTLRASIKELNQEMTIPLNRFILPAPRMYSYYETAIPFESPEVFSLSEKAGGIKGQSIKEVTVNAKKKKRSNIDFDHPNNVFDFQETYDFSIDHGESYRMTSLPDTWFGADNIAMFLTIHSYIGRLEVNDAILYDNKPWSTTIHSSFGVLNSTILPTERIEKVALYSDVQTRMKHLSKKGEVPGAVISFNSYKNGFSRPKNQANLRYTTLQGYSNVREFYSPQYTDKILPDVKDYRRTLYWNPDVKTDSTGNALVRFFNNSSCKTMTISAETITKDGEIGLINE